MSLLQNALSTTSVVPKPNRRHRIFGRIRTPNRVGAPGQDVGAWCQTNASAFLSRPNPFPRSPYGLHISSPAAGTSIRRDPRIRRDSSSRRCLGDCPTQPFAIHDLQLPARIALVVVITACRVNTCIARGTRESPEDCVDEQATRVAIRISTAPHNEVLRASGVLTLDAYLGNACRQVDDPRARARGTPCYDCCPVCGPSYRRRTGRVATSQLVTSCRDHD